MSDEFARLVERADWMRHAACAGADVDLWFPERGHAAAAQSNEAKAVCATCPVRAECLAYAIDNNEMHGIWGGYSRKERQAIKAGRPVKRRQSRCGTAAGHQAHVRAGETPCVACREARARYQEGRKAALRAVES